MGTIYDGKVTGITKFGAFVALPGGKSGMVHISEIANTYVEDIKQFLTEGQEVKVKLIAIDEQGRINLSIKKALPEKRPERPQRPRQAVPARCAAHCRKPAIFPLKISSSISCRPARAESPIPARSAKSAAPDAEADSPPKARPQRLRFLFVWGIITAKRLLYRILQPFSRPASGTTENTANIPCRFASWYKTAKRLLLPDFAAVFSSRKRDNRKHGQYTMSLRFMV